MVTRVEQVQSKLPQVQIWFYGEETITCDEITVEIGENKVNCTDVFSVEESTAPTQYYVLVDCSTSTTGAQLAATKDALLQLANRKKEADQLTVISFGVSVDVLLDGETDIDLITTVVDGLQADQAGTLFFDALAKVSEIASKETVATDRKVLFAFSDSVDYNLGGYTKDETEDLLIEAGLPLYAIGYDSGTKENLDNFGALARATGGDIAIVNGDNLLLTFTERLEQITEEAQCAVFTTATNMTTKEVVPITFTVGEENHEIDTLFRYWIADESVPTIVEGTQVGADGLELVFSESVSGATVEDNYKIVDGEDRVLGIEAIVYQEESNCVQITLEEIPYTEEISVQCVNITDVSMEKNPVEQMIEIPITNEKPKETLVEEESGAPIVAWMLLTLMIVGIILGIVFGKKKKIVEETEDEVEPLGEQSIPSTHFQSQGQGSKAHFVKSQLRQMILDVADGNGQSKRVTLNIDKSLFVGRSDICDVIFDDPQMSRQHFVIEVDEYGQYSITNLSTTKPAILNGIPIQKTRALQNGDRIQAGNQYMTFKESK
ncbi:MAG: FHA domain-containing protein [Eubacteriales bacterium]